MCTFSGAVLNWSVATAMWMDVLNIQPTRVQMKSHLQIIYRSDAPSIRSSMELPADPIHMKEMPSNSQVPSGLKSSWEDTGAYWDRCTSFSPEWGL